jgi:hypothetical protein
MNVASLDEIWKELRLPESGLSGSNSSETRFLLEAMVWVATDPAPVLLVTRVPIQ